MDEGLIGKCRDARGRVSYEAARIVIYNRFEEIKADARVGFLMRVLVDLRLEAAQQVRNLRGSEWEHYKRNIMRSFLNFAQRAIFEAWMYYEVKCSEEQSVYLEERLTFFIADGETGKVRHIAIITKEQIAEPWRLKGVEERDLPTELDTEAARKYFKRAKEAGFMEEVGGRCKWKFGGNMGKIRLGYFLSKVYEPPRPINDLEVYFGVKKLSADISHVENDEVKSNSVKKWRAEIDRQVFYD